MTQSHGEPTGPDPHRAEGAAEWADVDRADADRAEEDMVEEGGRLGYGQELRGESAGSPDPAGPAPAAADQPAEDAPGTPDAAQSAQDELAVTRMELAERTADLQRLQAEFLNYKRRVERDRSIQVENTTYKVLSPIIEVLDTIDRAREHGPLEDGLKAVADQLQKAVASQGLVRFGEPGDAFDPNLHDALSHLGEDAEVGVTTVKVVPRAGYRIGERVVRAAQVLVVDPPSA